MAYKTQLNGGQVFLSPNISTDTALNIYVEGYDPKYVKPITDVLTPENLASINVYSSVSETQDILIKHYGGKKWTGSYSINVSENGTYISFGLAEYSSLEARIAALEKLLKDKGVE